MNPKILRMILKRQTRKGKEWNKKKKQWLLAKASERVGKIGSLDILGNIDILRI